MKLNRSAPGDSNGQTDEDKAGFLELFRTLDNAYENAVSHKAANPDSETADLLLENASIRLSSRILSAMNQAPCRQRDPGTIGARTEKCSLDDESIHLRDLTDVLSYAANSLQQLATSMAPRDVTQTLEIARIRSMEHLYRMTFAISKAHFDPSQSGSYFQVAHEQLTLARNSLQAESDLCACSSKGYSGRLLELSEVDQLLSQVNPDSTRQ
jgi:hypothetical protein